MFPWGTRAGVAVSGGADSVCLLELLRELSGRLGIELTILHVNHGLRGAESDADEQFVRDLGQRSALPVLVEHAPVTGGNVEQTARDLRRSFFVRELESGRLHRVALAHTRDDQAETVLFRFLRGAYTTGLAGMRPVTPEGLVRPLLEADRDAVREFLAGRGLDWREDSSNLDHRFTRNRIRHSLLPALIRDWNPGLAGLLASHAQLAQDDEDYWRGEVDRIAADLLVGGDGDVVAPVARLAALPNALLRRVIRRAITVVKGNTRQIDFQHVENVVRLVRRGASESGETEVPGVEIVRSFGSTRFSLAGADAAGDYSVELTPPCTLELPGSGFRVSMEIVDREERMPAETGLLHATLKADLDWAAVQSLTSDVPQGGCIVLRNWKPGDAYQPAGRHREHKLKHLFHESRIAIWERGGWPVITADGRIVWSRQFGPAARVAPGPSTRWILRVEETNRRVPESDHGLSTSV